MQNFISIASLKNKWPTLIEAEAVYSIKTGASQDDLFDFAQSVVGKSD